MKNPSRWFGVWTVLAGLLNVLAGLALAAVGFGFANSTACGTGAGLAFVGLWMVLACGRVSRSRPATLVGLGLAWAWMFFRIFLDFSAVGSSIVLFLFLIPAVSLPIGLAWILLTLGWAVALYVSLVRNLPREGLGSWTIRTICVSGLLLFSLVASTFLMPELSWFARGNEISNLAQKYSAASPKRATPAVFGACSMSFLGYSLTQHGAEMQRDPEKRQRIYERALRDGVAELASAKAAGARYFRLGASGDQLLIDKPEQEAIDDRYVGAVRAAGMPLVLVDTQHPDVCRRRKLGWAEFCQFQRNRIQYYQSRYKPDVYFVVCEPMSYHGFALTADTHYSGAAWAAQLSEMCRLVKSLNPATRTGICLLVMKEKEPEWEVWSQMRTLPELDLLSVEIYQPQDFASTEERLAKYGHPRESGKRFWIAETYNGWALNRARRWDQDARWLEICSDYSRVVDAEVVLVWSFCTFVPEGSFWDFGNGELSRKWGQGNDLSLVGRTFKRLASPEEIP